MNQKMIERLLHLSFGVFLFLVFWLVYGQFISLELGLLRALINVLSMAGLYYATSHLVDKYLERRQLLLITKTVSNIATSMKTLTRSSKFGYI